MTTLLKIYQNLFSLLILLFSVVAIGSLGISQNLVIPEEISQKCIIPKEVETDILVLLEASDNPINCSNQNIAVKNGGKLLFQSSQHESSLLTNEADSTGLQLLVNSLSVDSGALVSYVASPESPILIAKFREAVTYQSRKASENMIIDDSGNIKSTENIEYLFADNNKGIIFENTRSAQSYFNQENDTILSQLADIDLTANFSLGTSGINENSQVLGASDQQIPKPTKFLDIEYPSVISIFDQPDLSIFIRDNLGNSITDFTGTFSIKSSEPSVDYLSTFTIGIENVGSLNIQKPFKFYSPGEYFLTITSSVDFTLSKTIKVKVNPPDAPYMVIRQSKSVYLPNEKVEYSINQDGVEGTQIVEDSRDDFVTAVGKISGIPISLESRIKINRSASENPKLNDSTKIVTAMFNFVSGYFINTANTIGSLDPNTICPVIEKFEVIDSKSSNEFSYIAWKVKDADSVWIDGLSGLVSIEGSAVLNRANQNIVRLKAQTGSCTVTKDLQTNYKSTGANADPLLFIGMIVVFEIGAITLGTIGITIPSGSIFGFLMRKWKQQRSKDNVSILFWDVQTNKTVKFLPFCINILHGSEKGESFGNSNDIGIAYKKLPMGRFFIKLMTDKWKILSMGQDLNIIGSTTLRKNEFILSSLHENATLVIPVVRTKKYLLLSTDIQSLLYELSAVGPLLFLLGLVGILFSSGMYNFTIINGLIIAVIFLLFIIKVFLLFFERSPLQKITLESLDGRKFSNIKVTLTSKEKKKALPTALSNDNGEIYLFIPKAKYLLKVEDKAYRLLGKKVSLNQAVINTEASILSRNFILFPRVNT